MSQLLVPSLLVAASLTATALTQQPAGLMTGMPPAGVQAASLGVPVGGELIARIPAESYRGIGEFVAPASHRIRGVVVNLLDVTQGNAESFDLHVYLEQGQTNLPTVQAAQAPGVSAVASALGLVTSAGMPTHRVEVTFAAPVDVPIGSDLFVGVVPHSADLRLRAVTGTSLPGFLGSLVDGCGAGLPQGASYLLFHDGGVLEVQTTGLVGWQPMIDLLVGGSAGVAVAQLDAQQPPTASFFSGLHPDARTPPNQTSRHDVPGYSFRGNGALSAGSPVFLLGSVEAFSGSPWIVLQPGNAALHLFPVGLIGLTMAATDVAGNATLLWPLPQSSAVAGAHVRSQAFGFDLTTGSVHAGAAVLQRF